MLITGTVLAVHLSGSNGSLPSQCAAVCLALSCFCVLGAVLQGKASSALAVLGHITMSHLMNNVYHQLLCLSKAWG